MLMKRVSFGDVIPCGYRVFRYDTTRHQAVCAPIGVHWLLRWCYRLWEKSYRYGLTDLERMQFRLEGLERQNERLRRELRDSEARNAAMLELHPGRLLADYLEFRAGAQDVDEEENP